MARRLLPAIHAKGMNNEKRQNRFYGTFPGIFLHVFRLNGSQHFNVRPPAALLDLLVVQVFFHASGTGDV